MKIKTLDEYKSVVKNLRQKGRPVINNNLLMVNQIEDMLQQNAISFHEDVCNTYIYLEHKTYYQLILMATDPSSVKIEKRNKPIRFDYTLRRDEELIKLAEDMMINNQLVYISQNIEMILSNSTKNKIQSLKNQKLKIRPVKDHEIGMLLGIWHDNLNPLINEIPSYESLIESHDNIYAVTYDGQVIGGVTLIYRGKRVYIEQVVIRRSFQGKGFGISILDFVKNEVKTKDICLWASIDNKRALTMYKKYGFEYTNKVALQYMMEETI